MPSPETLRAQIDSQEFYDLMQAYRHAPLTPQVSVVAAFEAVKAFLLAAPTAPETEPRALIERHLGTRLKHDYGENPYVEVRVWEIALIAERYAKAVLLAARPAPETAQVIKEMREYAGPEGTTWRGACDRIRQWADRLEQASLSRSREAETK